MNLRKLDKYWVWLGVMLCLLYLLGYAQIPKNGLLVVLSIFFGGLLAIASILPNIQNYDKIKFIKKSGHMKDLIDYIRLPLNLSFVLIILEFINTILLIPINGVYSITINVVYLSLWGVFICSLFRILTQVPRLISS